MLAENSSNTAELSHTKSTKGLRLTLNAMLDKLEPMVAQARQLPLQVPDTRLKAETSVICVLAEKLVVMLRRRDPLSDDVKLSKISVAGAATVGLIKAWL
jgi:hypothetical protein